MKRKITVARGDGIGPEIMEATLNIMEKAGALLEPEFVEIGEKVYKKGFLSGIEEQTWDSLYRNKVFLKAPITTPQGHGFKSLNVAVRRTLGLYANVRRCTSYFPYVETKHKKFDVVIVRENEEDLYSGVEHRQTPQVYQCLKLFSQNGCDRICQFAFEYALNQDRKKVTCFTKDNIMKMTDGLFHKCFEKQSQNYPSLESDHWIIDIGCAKLADTPEKFDVIVTSNLYGDILSDMVAQMSGSVAMGASCNLGENFAMFEAIHGSAPRRAGQNLANPSGLLLSAIELLIYIEQPQVAEKIKNAWLKTLEDGLHTYDLFKKETSRKQVGTQEFAQAIIERLGEKPKSIQPAQYKETKKIKPYQAPKRATPQKELVGVDFFFEKNVSNIEQLAQDLKKCETSSFQLKQISCRGLDVWPGPPSALMKSDHWGARFLSETPCSFESILQLTQTLQKNQFLFIKMEGLFLFDGEPGFYIKK